ncbi:DUF11 domain-containing protein [Fibrella aquatilis]|uniref:DUF11 domain-containing protein n=1 Tax=Fibrella aquatilis TaxID=2817059 RepID=A0A939G1B1_9BACT|nr:DUF11 domain-containing protein [Fibrella aquatilis]MBO0930597.1 DUF11 domain-containing protein [Fibrella aquatilis]
MKPSILPTPAQRCLNTVVALRSYEGSPGQWRRNGVDIPDETSYIYYPSESGRYTIAYTYDGCWRESDPVEIKIGEPTAATLTGNALVNTGQAVQLPVAFTGPAPWSFTLSNGQSVQNTYLNPYLLSVTAMATSSYSIVGIENACGTGTAVGQATVTVGSGQADVSLAAQVSSRTPRVNDVVTYSLLVTNAGPQQADNVQVSSRLPAGVEFIDASSPGVSAVNGVVGGNVGTVPVGMTTTITYRLRITQPGMFFTAAQVVNTTTPDPDSQPNSGTGDGQDDVASVDLRTVDAGGALVASANPNQVPLPRVQVNQPPVSLTAVELSLTLRSSSLTPKAGDVISLSLAVGNRGGATANNLVVQTLLPAGWQLTNSTGFIVSGQTVKAYVNQLAPNGQTVLVLPVQVSTGNGAVQAQVLDVAEPVSNATPGNGYQNGELDEAGVLVRVR